MAQHNVEEVCKAFKVEGDFIESVPYGSGHINDTYATTLEKDGKRIRYIHQRINHNIFLNPEGLMDNINRVTKHVAEKIKARNGEILRDTLNVIMTKDDSSFHRDPEKNYWRMYEFIEDAKTYDVLTETKQALEAAKAFGQFQADLKDLPGDRLFEVIPFFHHTPKRFDTLEAAIESDEYKRASGCSAEIEFAKERKEFCNIVVDGLADGSIPERITHNDTKINNVMLDDATGKGLAVIDLDTVMPGSILYDFGDLCRTSLGHMAEDEQDLSKVFADMERFEALVEGYLSTAKGFLTEKEIDLLPLAGRLITFTVAIRFLTDHLSGDTYFKIHRENHNLDRAKVQFALVKSMEDHEDEMKKIVAKYR